jgi:hypothetical protein
MDFRLRIIRDYLKPNDEMPYVGFQRHFVDGGKQSVVYKVERKPTLVINPCTVELNKARVRGTFVVNLQTKVAALLNHPEPAVRILITYDFLSDNSIPGIPFYETFPFHENDVPT